MSSRKRLKVGRLRFKSLTVVVPPDGGGCCRRGGCHSEAPVLDGSVWSFQIKVLLCWVCFGDARNLLFFHPFSRPFHFRPRCCFLTCFTRRGTNFSSVLLSSAKRNLVDLWPLNLAGNTRQCTSLWRLLRRGRQQSPLKGTACVGTMLLLLHLVWKSKLKVKKDQ